MSLSDENTALLTDATKWMVIASKGDKGDQGYTVQLKIGTVGSGDQPSVSLTDAGVDEQGNPVKEINFVLKRGKTGYTPIIEVGTVTTVDPKSEASIELIDNGLSEEGVQKYLLNASIPRGETGLPGKGAGNVYVIGDNLEVGKNTCLSRRLPAVRKGLLLNMSHRPYRNIRLSLPDLLVFIRSR